MRIIEQFSPNSDARDPERQVEILVLHYTGMKSGDAALQWMCNPKSGVSAHYMVEEDGTVYYIVPEAKRAWHAGVSYWRGRGNLNHSSIGIEIVNPGHEWGYRPFPEPQMQSVITLCKDITERHSIKPGNVVAHSDIAPDRKQDPGELFDWERLANQGVGIWPGTLSTVNNTSLLTPGSTGNSVKELQHKLHRFGYDVNETGHYDEKTQLVVKAFKRHFCQQHVNEVWDSLADKTLNQLLVKDGI